MTNEIEIIIYSVRVRKAAEEELKNIVSMFLIKVTKHMGIPFSKLRKLQIVLL